ncbi:shikimate kinase [Bacteroidia bacterium]|nr:shikimate kinase [Bacteroidia bacterium]GHU57625.1 shikimate kinase [Bacteroidia bacterium]
MKRIFLIGYMGAGKTTIGKQLAGQMNLIFIDLDHHIEARYHRTISELFAEKGEEAFRDIERRMLHEVSMFENVLISTGGGAPCFFDNMEFMNSVGETVYIKVSPPELVNRLDMVRQTRPVLSGRRGNELLTFVTESLEVRKPFYEQASIIFEAEAMLNDSDVSTLVYELEKILLVN